MLHAVTQEFSCPGEGHMDGICRPGHSSGDLAYPMGMFVSERDGEACLGREFVDARIEVPFENGQLIPVVCLFVSAQ